KGKTGASFKVKDPPPPGQEPGLVPDIPRDITPEELDALSALAAQLDGPVPAAENLAPLAEKMGPAEPSPAEVQSARPEPAKAEVVKTQVEVPAVAAEAKAEQTKEVETPAPPAVEIVESSAAAVAAPALVAEATPKSTEKSAETSEAKISVEQVVAAPEPAAVVADTSAGEVP